MERYKISLRLNALPNAKVLNVNMGDGNIKNCVVIPIDENMVKKDNGDVYANQEVKEQTETDATETDETEFAGQSLTLPVTVTGYQVDPNA